jgi:hypothetical protein
MGNGPLHDLGYDYVNNQMKKIVPVDEYGVQIKVKSQAGETHWLSLDKENHTGRLSQITQGVQLALGSELGSLDTLSKLVEEMTLVILDKLGDDKDCKPVRIILEMKEEIKKLKGA